MIRVPLILFSCTLVALLALFLLQTPTQAAVPGSPSATSVRFAVIGDYGLAGPAELDVANVVKSWNPDFIITVGDNNYQLGAQTTIDANIGQYYSAYIYPYTGTYGTSSAPNRFFPTLGNHDWYTSGATPYRNYFTLPNNERYYDFVRGPVHFFALDSDSNEPDGRTSLSTQASWLRYKMLTACEQYKIVYLHHAPYSSAKHGSNTTLQWNYASWGATAVLAGHDHTYERIIQNGIPYFVNGLGGADIYTFTTPIAGSVVRYDDDWGAMRVDADDASITFSFINRSGTLIDTQTISATAITCISPIPIFLPFTQK